MSWSSTSRIVARPSKRLRVEPLEAREVPATFTVTMFADVVNPADGRQSLREAISRANSNPGADTILLKAGTYVQTLQGEDDTNAAGDFDVTDSLTITGVGPVATVIKGSRDDRLFELIGPIAGTFNNLGLRDGGDFGHNGGAVQARFADIALNNCVVINNVADHGGAINADNGSVTVRGSRLTHNLGFSAAGAIRMGSGSLLLDRSTVVGNSANAGGGIFADTGAVTLFRSTVALNTALLAGGGINAKGGDVTLSNSSVRGNLAGGDGGGIVAGGAAVVTNSTVTGNRSTTGSGGGIRADSATIRDSTINGNSCQFFGGGLTAGAMVMTNTTVSGNTSQGEGGGIGASDLGTLTNCTLSGNTAGSSGGGISGETVNLTNCTISGNIAGAGPDGTGDGGGVSAGNGTILNSTIVENRTVGRSSSQGAGVATGGAAPELMRVRNTIIARNFDAFGEESDVSGTFLSQGNNLIGAIDGDLSGFGAAGDLAGTFDDPLDPKLAPLANNGGPTRTHARLAGSPAIDHGNSLGAPALDQRGLPRIRDGNGDHTAVVDIGAFER